MIKKLNVSDILAKKGVEKIAMITAYDALFTKLFDPLVDMILIGDSLNMSFGGKNDTLSLKMRDMIYHSRVVASAASHALIVADMPFGATLNEKDTLKNAVKLYKKSGVDAVKIECHTNSSAIISRLSDEGIATIAHIGLRPQQARFEGGYHVKGKNLDESKILLENALKFAQAGAFCVLMEGTISQTASEITKALKVPTIGIGSGANTDGQVLVWSDMLGFFDEFKPKFVKRYLNGATLVREAVGEYVREIKSGAFPSEEFEYKIK